MSINKFERLRHIEKPEVFTRESLGILLQAALPEMAKETAFASEVAGIIRSEDFQNLVDSGRVTLAMVKPQVDLASPIEASDSEVAHLILDNIAQPLEKVFDVSLILTEEMIQEFYVGRPKEVQQGLEPVDSKRYGQDHKSRWEEFVSWMQQGPVTFCILFSQSGDAPSQWRSQMGDDWNIQRLKESAPDSIRARFALDNEEHNNLLHGSDSTESAKRELLLLAKMLETIATTD